MTPQDIIEYANHMKNDYTANNVEASQLTKASYAYNVNGTVANLVYSLLRKYTNYNLLYKLEYADGKDAVINFFDRLISDYEKLQT